MNHLSFTPFALLIVWLGFTACTSENNAQSVANDDNQPSLSFQSRKIVDSAQFWWAHCPAQVSDDNLVDLVFIHNNASGGYLGYYQAQQDSGLWEKHIIAQAPPTGGLFASGDLECADIDFDGDIDVLAVKHPGEWTDAGAEAELFWYENPSWQPHSIGKVPDAVKDISLADFNGDRKMDMAVLTFDEHTLSIFQQEEPDQWERVQFFDHYHELHEGMAVGDLNGDERLDIVANAYAFYNPGEDLAADWSVENMDSLWNTQEGDWSRNGTKAFTRDIDDDGAAEVFISHSERAGYPLAYYQRDKQGTWQKHIISDSIPACHTLQVYDFDQDGDFDVLAGINQGRAINLGINSFEVMIFLSDNNYQSWQPMTLEKDGIYNGQVADYDQDGDFDIFRYPNHEATDFYVLENQLKE